MPKPMAHTTDSHRPPWQLGESICNTLPGFTPRDDFPERSPLIMVDYLLPYVENKVYVEIGTRHGDNIRCLKHFAKRVAAIEILPEYCDALRDNGVRVECQCFERLTPDAFPRADVFYWWPALSIRDNEPWLLHASHLVREQNRTALAIIAFDANDRTWSTDLKSFARMATTYNPTRVDRLFFDEALPAPIGYLENRTGITNGRYGVFHVAHFPLPLHNATIDVEARHYRVNRERLKDKFCNPDFWTMWDGYNSSMHRARPPSPSPPPSSPRRA